jgi:hypothetical protein
VVYKNKNIPLSGLIVRKKKAKEIAETFNENFRVSFGCLCANSNGNSNSVDTDDFINLNDKLEDNNVDSATKMLLCTLVKSTKKFLLRGHLC